MSQRQRRYRARRGQPPTGEPRTCLKCGEAFPHPLSPTKRRICPPCTVDNENIVVQEIGRIDNRALYEAAQESPTEPDHTPDLCDMMEVPGR